MSKINLFFQKKSILVFSIILSLFLWAISLGNSLMYNLRPSFACNSGLFFLLVLGMLLAYNKGNINIQKMLFGSILFAFVKFLIDVIIESFGAGMITIGWVCVVLLLFSVIIFVFHMLQQTEHDGKKAYIVINHLCGVVILLGIIILIISKINGTLSYSNFIGPLAAAFTYLMVICMESRVAAYKLLRTESRQNGTWTEEKRNEAKRLFKL